MFFKPLTCQNHTCEFPKQPLGTGEGPSLHTRNPRCNSCWINPKPLQIMCLLCSHCYVPELFPGTQVLLLLGNPSSAGVTSTARGSALDLWSRPRRPQFHRGSVIPGQIAGQWLQITPRHLLSSSHGLHYLTKDTAFLLSAPHCPFPVYLYATFSMILHPKSSKSPLWTQVSSTSKKPCTDSAGWIRTTNSGQGWEGKPELPTQQPGSTLSMFPWQWGQMRRML